MARAAAGLPVIARVDAAEARGVASMALRLIQDDLARRPESEMFWRHDRIKHLVQLETYGAVLPAWVYSRWILEQAVRWMDTSQRGRWTRAYDRTVQIIGDADRYGGVDEVDASCQLMDHDWVYRQLVLYEYGGLQHFLDRVAARSLIVRADRVRGWSRAPMGAYRLIGQSACTVTWWDLGNEHEVETPNIGSAVLVEVGEHVIGRLVPTAGEPMFESAPVVVPYDVAADVAADPYDWMSALERGCHHDTMLEETITTRIAEFTLLSDVPPVLEYLLVDHVVRPDEAASLRQSHGEVVDGRTVAVRAALEDRLGGAVLFEPWPVVGAMLLEPPTFMSLASGSMIGDSDAFRRLAERMASPAAEVCRVLAEARDVAA